MSNADDLFRSAYGIEKPKEPTLDERILEPPAPTAAELAAAAEANRIAQERASTAAAEARVAEAAAARRYDAESNPWKREEIGRTNPSVYSRGNRNEGGGPSAPASP